MAKKLKMSVRASAGRIRNKSARKGKKVVRVVKEVVIPRAPRLRRQNADSGWSAWLRRAIRDPFDVKPPDLGIRGEATHVVAMRVRLLVEASPALRVIVRPYSYNMLGARANSDGSGETLSWYNSQNAASVAGMFGAARPICGGVRFTTFTAATDKPALFTAMQQGTSKTTAQWYNPTGAGVGTTGELLGATQQCPAPVGNGSTTEKLWNFEDFEDLQMDSDLLTNVVITGQTFVHPILCAAFSGLPATGSVYIDVVFWMEALWNSSVANIFGSGVNQTWHTPEQVMEADRGDEKGGYYFVNPSGSASSTAGGSFTQSVIGLGGRLLEKCANNETCRGIVIDKLGNIVKGHYTN